MERLVPSKLWNDQMPDIVESISAVVAIGSELVAVGGGHRDAQFNPLFLGSLQSCWDFCAGVTEEFCVPLFTLFK